MRRVGETRKAEEEEEEEKKGSLVGGSGVVVGVLAHHGLQFGLLLLQVLGHRVVHVREQLVHLQSHNQTC